MFYLFWILTLFIYSSYLAMSYLMSFSFLGPSDSA
jgi:hypothetical protein